MHPRSWMGTTAFHASGAVLASGIAAFGSLLLQVAAVRWLGAAGYGAYAVVLATLVTLTAVQGAWVGDSLTVLDRSEPLINGAIRASQWALAGAGGVIAATLVLVLDLGDATTAMLLFSMTVLWVSEEAGRRLLMARMEFSNLVANDAIYVLVALVSLGVLRMVSTTTTLDTFILAMGLGSLAAVVTAIFQVPKHERRGGPVTSTALRTVAGFAAWRAAQAGIRPLALTVARILIAGLATTAALGRLETARLLSAPVMIFCGGLGSFLLPSYARRPHRHLHSSARIVVGPMTLLVVTTLVSGVLAVTFSDSIVALLTSGEVDVDRTAVAGWFVYTVAFAAGVPAMSAMIVRRKTRTVFMLRALDSLVALPLVVACLLLEAENAVPFALATGAFLGVGLMLYANRRAPRAVGGEQPTSQ